MFKRKRNVTVQISLPCIKCETPNAIFSHDFKIDKNDTGVALAMQQTEFDFTCTRCSQKNTMRIIVNRKRAGRNEIAQRKDLSNSDESNRET